MKPALAQTASDMSSAGTPTVADEEIDTVAKPRASSTFASSHYFAKALPAIEGGFTGQYGAPGLTPTRIRDDSGDIAVFETESEAELAAYRALASVLNTRSQRLRQSKLERYRKMTGAELAVELAEVGITPTLLAYLKGADPSRVLKWLEDPNEDVPHDIRVLLALFKADRHNIDIAEAVTADVTTLRQPKERD